MRTGSVIGELIEKTKRLYHWLFRLGPTDKEWDDYLQSRLEQEAEWQREWEEQQREHREYIAQVAAEEAEHERENEEYERLKKEWEQEDAEREDRLAEQKRRDQACLEEQERYLSECPWCGSAKVWGRCPACDRAFGRN